MNEYVIQNFSKVKPTLFIVPLLLVLIVVAFLCSHHALNAAGYTAIQRDWFYYLNTRLSQYPRLEYNLTQFGDALISLSLLSMFVLYAPRLWEVLITSNIISGLLSRMLKEYFSVPRPFVSLDKSTFTIVGRAMVGPTSSLPSGHSITIFTMLTALMFAFMPENKAKCTLWFAIIIIVGLVMASSRIGVGAHFPLDVLIGSLIGYISSITGILVNRKYPIWGWINNKRYYPIFIVLFSASFMVIVSQILKENLFIFYLALVSLIFSLYAIIKAFIKRKHTT